MTQEPIQNVVLDRIEQTPFGARKTAALDVQFSINPAYGLSRERFGWYSNLNLFDSTHFSEGNGQIEIETSATGTDSAELRSAYSGQYTSHTLAEPGCGVEIPEQYLEYDTSGDGETVSLTHGEITIGLIEVDRQTQTGVNTHAISYESDGVYAQIRKDNTDIVKVRQDNWNIDPLDGTGPSGKVLRPEKGYVYNFPYTWYGQGALIIAIQDPVSGNVLPMHKSVIDGGASLGTPNMPVEVAIQNQGTAEPLGANVGGMQFATHGSSQTQASKSGRETTISRQTASNYIDLTAQITNNEIDPFAEAGRPLVSARRDQSTVRSRVALGVEVFDMFVNSGGDLYLFVFDDWEAENSLTGQNFRESSVQQIPSESRLEVDTEATAYNPGPNAILRNILYVSGDKNTAETITGASNTRVPIDATTVTTAALPPGNNSTYAQPAMLTLRERF